MPKRDAKQMTKPTKPKVPEKADDKEQSEAFIRAAQDAKTNEDPQAFERIFEKVSRQKTQRAAKKS